MTPSPFQSSAAPGDRLAGERSEPAEPINSEPTMPPSTDQQEKVEAAIAELERDILILAPNGSSTSYRMVDAEDLRTLLTAFAAERGENERLGLVRREALDAAKENHDRATSAEARITAQAETINELVGALQLVRMSLGWQYMSDETKAIVRAALSADTGSREG